MNSKRIMKGLWIMICLFFSFAGAFAEETVKSPASVIYLDENGSEQVCEAAMIESDTVTWNETWYIAEGTVTVPSRVEVIGNVKLILADGCTLTAEKGIHVKEGNGLTIYGQSTDSMGTLISKSLFELYDGQDAGIGGNENENSGTITINGGVVDVESTAYYAAAIGGGKSGEGTVVINGGKVKVSASLGAGIGGGAMSGGTVLINGGEIIAESRGGAGIGGGYGSNYPKSSDSHITIHGGTVTAASVRVLSDRLSGYSAGIGGGGEGDAYVTITGGTITASAEKKEGTGIGGGYNGSGYVTITGGSISAVGSLFFDSGLGIMGREGICAGEKGYVRISPSYGLMKVETEDGPISGSPFQAPGTYDIKSELSIRQKATIRTAYPVVIGAGEGGTAAADCAYAFSGERVQLTNQPGPGRHFKKWQTKDVTLRQDDTFFMEEHAAMVTAIFESCAGHSHVVEGMDSTYIEGGYKDCWKCDVCGTYYEDEKCTVPIENYDAWKSNEGRTSALTFTISFDMNGKGLPPAAQQVEDGGRITEPEEPKADGYTFMGWYADKERKTAFDFGTAIHSDRTVYAKWVENQEPATGDNRRILVGALVFGGCVLALFIWMICRKKRNIKNDSSPNRS